MVPYCSLSHLLNDDTFWPVSGSFFFSSRRRHTRLVRDWSSDVCSSDLVCRLLLEIEILHDRTPVTAQAVMPSPTWTRTRRHVSALPLSNASCSVSVKPLDVLREYMVHT